MVKRLLQFAERFAKWRDASCNSRRRSPNGRKPLAIRGEVRQMVERLLHFAETFAKWRKGSCISRRGSPNGGKPLAVRGRLRRLVESLLQFAERFAKWRKASCSSRNGSLNGEKPLAFRGEVRQMVKSLLQIAETFAKWWKSSCNSRKTSAKWRKASCISRRGSPNGEKPLANRGEVRQMAERLLQFAERFGKWWKASCSSRNGSPNGGKPLAVRGDFHHLAISSTTNNSDHPFNRPLIIRDQVVCLRVRKQSLDRLLVNVELGHISTATCMNNAREGAEPLRLSPSLCTIDALRILTCSCHHRPGSPDQRRRTKDWRRGTRLRRLHRPGYRRDEAGSSFSILHVRCRAGLPSWLSR